MTDIKKLSDDELQAYIWDTESILTKAKELLASRARVQPVLAMLTQATDMCTKQYSELKRLALDTLKQGDIDQIEANLMGLSQKANELKHNLNKFTEALLYVQSGIDPEQNTVSGNTEVQS